MALTLQKEDFLEGETARTIAQARIQKGMYGGLLIEKSEGSRGGKVIGHTKSGKPIYDSHYSPSEAYGKFTKEDHLDAAKFHGEQKVMSARTARIGDQHQLTKKHKQAAEWHQGEADNFMESKKEETKPKTKEEIDKEQKESKIKVGTGTFNGKENWRVTSDKHDDIGVFPKDKYSKEEAEAEYNRKINKSKDIKKSFEFLGIEI